MHSTSLHLLGLNQFIEVKTDT